MGKGSPQYRCRLNNQSRSLYVTAPWPYPYSSSHPIIAAFAPSTPIPSRVRVSRAEFTAGPSPTNALPAKSPGGCTVRTIGSPNASAKSQSR